MWNHRLVCLMDDLGNEYLEIAEVYYDTDGKPYAYGQATIVGENVDEIHTQLEWFQKAIAEPMLKFPEEFIGDAYV